MLRHGLILLLLLVALPLVAGQDCARYDPGFGGEERFVPRGGYLDSYVIESITPGSPADRAGLQQHDRIIAVNGRYFEDLQDADMEGEYGDANWEHYALHNLIRGTGSAVYTYVPRDHADDPENRVTVTLERDQPVGEYHAKPALRTQTHQDRVLILEAYEGWDAYNKGVRDGYTLLGIDGVPLSEVPDAQKEDALKGVPGTRVTLTLQNDKEITVTRDYGYTSGCARFDIQEYAQQEAPQTDPATYSQTPEERQSPLATHLLDTCGVHEGFIVPCYMPQDVTAINPAADSLPKHIATLIHEAESGDTLKLAVVGDDETATKRAAILQDTAEAVARVQGKDIKVVPAPGATGKADTALIITEERARTITTTDGRVQTAATPKSAEWADTFWLETKATQSERLRELSDRIYEEKHIRVIPLLSTTPWPTKDEEALTARIQDRAAEILAYLPAEERAYYSDHEIQQPCTVYLLVDKGGVHTQESSGGGQHALQSRHCGLHANPYEIRDADPTEQEIVLLESALKHTKPAQPGPLMMVAYSRVIEGDRAYGLRLADWIIARWEEADTLERTGELAALRAANSVVHAQDALSNADDDTEFRGVLVLASNALTHAEGVWRGRAAVIAATAASALDDCARAQRYVDEHRSAIRDVRNNRQALEQVQACHERELKKTLKERLPKIPDENARLTILIVNDGMPDASFGRTSDAIQRRLAQMPGLREHAGAISWWEVEASDRIAESLGQRTPALLPRVDGRALQFAAAAKRADYVLVLSEEHFYPTTWASTGFGTQLVSTSACGYDQGFAGGERCVALYAARGLALRIFQLEPEDHTVTANLPRNPQDSALDDYFNAQQREEIHEWFDTR